MPAKPVPHMREDVPAVEHVAFTAPALHALRLAESKRMGHFATGVIGPVWTGGVSVYIWCGLRELQDHAFTSQSVSLWLFSAGGFQQTIGACPIFYVFFITDGRL